MRPAALSSVLLLVALGSAPARAAKVEEAPAWLRDAAASARDPDDPKARALVLLDEGSTTVTGVGTKRRRLRYAIRISTDAGRGLAVASVPYLQGAGEVSALRAWLITPSGTVKAYGKKEVADLALMQDVYSDYRIKQIDARAAAVPGAVFGWESEEEERSIFLQETWSFQGLDPVAVSRYRLELPEGWQADARGFNHPEVVASRAGAVWTWELRDLPRIEPEEAGPGQSSLAPRLAIDYRPADLARADAPAFREWADVASWQAGLHAARLDSDPQLSARVRALTAGIEDRWAQIGALARFVQTTRYVSIQVGVARGGGYQPHRATEVLAKGYGDCKDKVNLLRAMLREIGVRSHSVAIYSGDPRRVVDSWPSPHQFNHAIVAIEVDPEVGANAAATYEGLGRLVFFDPTDDSTPLGWLPAQEYSTLVLVAKESGGALVRTPAGDPTDHHLARTVRATLSAEGTLSASVADRSQGALAARARQSWKSWDPKEYRDGLQRVLGQQAARSSITELAFGETWPSFERTLTFEAPQFGQRVGGALWLIKLAFLDSGGAYQLAESTRSQPLFLQAESRASEVALTLPEGWAVDELPGDIERVASFGELRASWRVEGSTLRFEQRLRIEAAEVPASEYQAVRELMRLARSAADQAVVLARR